MKNRPRMLSATFAVFALVGGRLPPFPQIGVAGLVAELHFHRERGVPAGGSVVQYPHALPRGATAAAWIAFRHRTGAGPCLNRTDREVPAYSPRPG